jgi:hypothetical protein
MNTKDRTTKDPTRRIPKRDPEGAYVRKAIGKRRVGKRRCLCGESRPEALLHDTVWCAECQRKHQGSTTEDEHHYAGAANDPTTLSVPVNDHRADLTTAQLDLPKQTRENPDGSPALAGAARVRGFVDTVVFLIRKGLLWVAEMLEKLDEALVKRLGAKWWLTLGLPPVAPAR